MKKKEMYVCKKCGHRVGTVGGIRGHVWKHHRDTGKDKTPIHKGVDFMAEKSLVSKRKAQGLSLLSGGTLVKIIEGRYDMNPLQKAAFDELANR